MVYVIQVCWQLSSRTILVLLESCLQTCVTYTTAECTVNKLLCPSSGVYSPYTQQWYKSNRFVDNFRAEPGWSCSKAVYKPVWHIPLLSVRWINSWWWTEELSETGSVSWQNKFVKLVYLVGFIIKKSYTHVFIIVVICLVVVLCCVMF